VDDAPTTPEPVLHAFGRWLRQERELRAVAPEEVAGATRLSAAIIEALESGEEGRMPPRAYVVGYLRAYAGAVGLDADEVVLRFQEAAGPAAPPATRRRGRSPVRVAAGALLAAAAVAAIVWALVRS
jgi:cytoskeletal protein RodZ